MHLSICVSLIIFQSSFITGAVLKFDKQTPTESNNYTCGVITCRHQLEFDDLSVEEISLFDIAGPARLVSVKPENCEHANFDDVILVSKAFSKTGAGVALGVRNASICSGGEFMCEVIYVNGRLDKVTDVQVVRPNTLTRYDLCRKLSKMTSSIETFRNQLGITNENYCADDRQASREWQLAFRGTAGAGMSVYPAYRFGVGIPDNVESGCKQVGEDLPCRNHYRNNAILDNWKGIAQVAFVVYKNNVKVREIIFDGVESTYMSWLDKSRVNASFWTDIASTSALYFNIEGDPIKQRTFFMNYDYGGCPNDVGWFVAVDSFDPYCPWEKPGPYPVFKYSTSETKMNWNDARVLQADYFGVLVRYF